MPQPPAPDNFWRNHLWPLGIMALVFSLLELFGLDRPIAHALYYSSTEHRWIGDSAAVGRWTHDIVHDGGRWLARAIGIAALLAWAASFFWARARSWRRAAGFVFVAIALSVGTVGLLKVITNVDCPWNLAEFGGTRPYVALFADRPDALPRAQCFPGAHASAGFALVCFYFAWRGRSLHKARWALLVACCIGIAFSIGQEARGAHFLSHDLAAAAIVWMIQLALYAWLLRPAHLLQVQAGQRVGEHAAGEAPNNISRPA
jgi:membrane-associated PAP2 superfamily phosphatase